MRRVGPLSPALRRGAQGIVIVGHSTGCQDAVRYCQRYRGSGDAPPAVAAPDAAPLLGVVLQAPVSDVQWLATQPGTAERTQAARQLVAEGRGEEVAFRATDVDGAAMTARRWLSLAVPGGDDDMFSSTLSDEQLGGILAPLRGLPTLVLLSGAEEYVPPSIDYTALGRRLAQVRGAGCWGAPAADRLLVPLQAELPPRLQRSSIPTLVFTLPQAIGPSARLEVVEGAPHALNGKEEEGAAAIAGFIASLQP